MLELLIDRINPLGGGPEIDKNVLDEDVRTVLLQVAELLLQEFSEVKALIVGEIGIIVLRDGISFYADPNLPEHGKVMVRYMLVERPLDLDKTQQLLPDESGDKPRSYSC